MAARLYTLASLSAVAGGLLLSLLAMLTVVSVLGRALVSRPIPGDFELVAVGTAIAVFLFLPYCQLQRGHIRVELFLGRRWPRLSAWLDCCGGVVCAVISGLFAWRMVLGLADSVRDRDVTVILGVPLWWAFPFAVFGFALLAACCIHTALADLQR